MQPSHSKQVPALVTCQLCQRRALPRDCHIIEASEEEAKIIQLSEGESREVPFCLPCWKVLSDPVSGPALLRGHFFLALQRLGVANAEEMATKYHAWLVKNATKPRS